MEHDEWLCGWREIGKYIGKSGRTAQRWAREGMPFFRDPGGRPITKASLIDEYLLDLNKCQYDDKTWQDEGIDTALEYEDAKKKARKDFDKQIIAAAKPPRCRF